MTNTKGSGRSAFSQIVLASDLTAFSDRAFDRSAMLAETHQAKLRFLHVVDSSLLPADLILQSVREAKAILEHDVRDSGLSARVDVSIKVLDGQADKVILEEASVLSADLIVMGLAAHASVSAVFGGTTIDRVVRGATCPVLAVKTRPRRDYASIVVGIDAGEPSRRALDLVLSAFPAARVTIVHVAERSGVEARHQIEDMIRSRCVAAGRPAPSAADGPTLSVKTGKAKDVLQEEIARLDPDLVALGTHGRTGVSKMFLGSVAETLLEVVPRDLLVVRG